jgi:hypothetical protein
MVSKILRNRLRQPPSQDHHHNNIRPNNMAEAAGHQDVDVPKTKKAFVPLGRLARAL